MTAFLEWFGAFALGLLAGSGAAALIIRVFGARMAEGVVEGKVRCRRAALYDWGDGRMTFSAVDGKDRVSFHVYRDGSAILTRDDGETRESIDYARTSSRVRDSFDD